MASRAVIRRIEPGMTARCEGCGESVKFRARERLDVIICNVYEDGRWDRVEQFHPDCYKTAGFPHGKAVG